MRAIHKAAFSRLTIIGVLLAVGVLLLVTMAPANAANAPIAFTATAGDSQVTLGWNIPNDSTISAYQVLTVAIDKLVGPSTGTGAIGAGDRFGDSVGIDGNRAVVGAPFQTSKDNSNNDIAEGGWGHAFSRGSGGWNYDEFLALSSPQEGGRLGSSVAVAGSTAIIGAPSTSQSNNLDAGRITIASKSIVNGSWATEFTKIGQAGNDLFGSSVALDTGIAVVGAPGAEASGHAFAGKAYLYTKGSSGTWGLTEAWFAGNSNVGVGHIFGISVAVDGNTVVVGSPGEDTFSGAVYVFTKGNSGWDFDARLTAPGAANNDSFGRSVAVDGNSVVVGAWQDDDGGADSGSTFVFTKPNAGWSAWGGLSSTAKGNLTAKLTASDAAADDHFGWSVAVDGDNVVVGAYGNDDDGTDSGSVYLFAKPSGAWATATETVKLTAPDGAAGDNFGESVAAGGGRAIVGAPGDESATGAAYVFSIPGWTDISGSGAGTTSHTVTGLTNGVEYTFLIRPVVGSGYGPASESEQATPMPSPAAPTNLAAVLGDGEVVLTWANPTDSAITKYQYSTNGGTSFTDIGGSGAATTAYVVTGLTNGAQYTLAVRAVNVYGAGMASTVTATPTAPPAVPVYLSNMGQTTAVNDLADLSSAQAQSFSTGANALGYLFGSIDVYLERAPGSGTLTVSVRNTNASAQPGSTVHTLTNPATVGTGIQRFTAPVDAQLNANTNYFLHLTFSGSGTTPRLLTTESDTLDSGTATGWSMYDFRYYSSGANWFAHADALKISINNVPPPVPAAPTNLVATPGDRQVVLTWTNPNNDTITKYQYSTDGGTSFSDFDGGSNKDTTSYTITDLTNGVTHTLAVRAVNSSGDGTAATVDAVMIPAAPANLTAMPRDGMVALGWDAPGNATITEYQLMQLVEKARLTTSDAAANDRFGVSVAVDNDTAVVGAFQPTYMDPDSMVVSRPGATYVYTRNPGTDVWSQQAKLTASDGVAGDEFGISVAVDGDNVVVGARGNDLDKGAIYVFSKPADDDWTSSITETKLTATGGAADDLFGASVALYGDTIVVGAPGDQITVPGGVVRSGSVYVFTKNSGVWGEAANLTATNAAEGDLFGNSVAVDDDTIAVGTYQKDDNSITNSGLAYVFVKPEVAAWATTTETVQLRASDQAANDNFGRSVAIDTGTIVVGASGDRIGGTDVSTGSAYVFTEPNTGWANSGGAETAKLTASDGAHTDQFGRSVAVDGDTIVVGAHQNDDDGSDSGSIYVFIKPTNGWEGTSGTVKLTASNAATGDRFGIALALDGDTALVAAPRNDANDDDDNDDNDVSDAGSAYVIGTSGWAKIPDDAAAIRSQTLTGLTNNIKHTFAVRAVNASGNGPASTASAMPAPVPDAPTGLSATPGDGQVALSWTDPDNDTIRKYQYSTEGGANFSDFDGGSSASTTSYTVTGLDNGVTYTLALRAVNISGAGAASTVTAVMVPAAPKLSAAPGDGQVVLSWDDPGNPTIGEYQLSQSDPPEWSRITGSNATTHTVTGLTNYTRYSFQIRAVNETGAGPASNSASATPRLPKPAKPAGLTAVAGDKKVTLRWTDPDDSTIDKYQISEVIPEDFLTATDGKAGAHFGISVAIDGDTAVVGADRANSRKGSVYIFTRDSTGDWTQQAKLEGENTGDQFGWSVAVDGDTVVVGAHADDGNNDDDETLVNSGAVYVITKPDTDANSDGSSDWKDWNSLSDDDRARLTDTLTATTPEAYAFFGGSVDLDGNTLAIGARRSKVGDRLSSGAAYVFTKSGTGVWSQAAKLTASIPLQLAYLGYSLAVDGDTVLVGAYGDDTVFGELGSGSAYVFDKPPGGWTDGNETAKLTASDRQPSGYFGFSVALDGDTAVIGARQHNDPGTGAGSGAAYVFTRESSVWGEKAKLTPSDAAAGDNFGVSVAVEDGTVVVGSWQDDDNGRNSGSAYVFTKPDLGWANTFETMKFTDPDGADNDRFGWSVGVDLDAVRGDLALVGVYSDDNANGTDAGSVHVFGIPDWVNIGDENDDGIDYNDDGTITHHVIKVPDGTDTDLSNGTEYTFQIRAVNDGGVGPASEGASATPVGPPAELMGLAADPGDSQVRLHWAAPTPSGAVAPITGYQYQFQEQDADGNFGAWSNVWTEIHGGGTVTEHTKARLANTAHRFRVRAVNKIGDGPSSEVDATPVSVTPLAPGLSATPGDTQVRLEWPDPGDFSIDKYQHRWIERGGTLGAWDDVPKGADGTIIRAVTVTGLINNTTYTFDVRAVDERDGGAEASDPPATVDATPTAMGMQPAAPNLTSHPGNKRVGLAWDDPDDASIDKYQYRWIEMGSTLGDWNDVPTGADGTIIHAVTVTGLINGTTYTFEVHAVDVHDGGDEAGAVARVDATPMPDRPEQPTGLGARAGNRQVALRWDDPNDETISNYEVLHLLRTSELHASSGSTNDKFGYAVAVDGDTAVVGAYRDDSSGDDSGAAYVFTRNPVTGLWGGGVKLTASGGAAYDNFGISVAVDGTTDTVVVGASGDDADATDSGSAYVFVKPAGGGWAATSTPTARLTPSDGARLDYFGHSVAVSGDTVLVGAYQDDAEVADLEDSGVVYVFVKPSGAEWTTTSTQTTKLMAAAPAADDWFGVSVALDSDRALIGMPGDDANGVDSGSVYVFTRDSQTRNWDAGKKLTASDAAPGDWFGYAVAVDGDTVVVGAYRDDSTDNVVTDSGSAYVFVEPFGGWALWDDSTDKERAKLTASDGAAFDYFGYAVAVDADTVLVGAYQHDSIDPQSGSVIPNSGSAYVFTEDSESGDWSQTNKLTADGGEADDWFGYTVAVDRASHTALVGAGSAHVLDIHDWAELEGSGSGTTSATVDDLINGRLYDFQVRAVNLASEGPESDQLSATPRAPLGPPPSVGQETNSDPFFSDGDSVTFSVAENTTAGGIVGNVAATDPDDDTLTFSLSGDDASYFDLDVSTGQIKVGLETELDYESDATSYSVIVSVHDGKNAGGNTDPTIDDSITVAIDVTDVEEPPSQPGVPQVSSVGPTALTASWTAPENQGPEISDYDVRYREAWAGFQDAGYNGIGTSVTLDGLTPGTSYEVQVRAINAEGASPWSESGRGETEEAPPTPTPTATLEPTPEPTPETPAVPDTGNGGFAAAGNSGSPVLALLLGMLAIVGLAGARASSRRVSGRTRTSSR